MVESKTLIISSIKDIIKDFGPFIHTGELDIEPLVHHKFGGQKHTLNRFFKNDCEVKVKRGIETKGYYEIEYDDISLKNLKTILYNLKKLAKAYDNCDK